MYIQIYMQLNKLNKLTKYFILNSMTYTNILHSHTYLIILCIYRYRKRNKNVIILTY